MLREFFQYSTRSCRWASGGYSPWSCASQLQTRTLASVAESDQPGYSLHILLKGFELRYVEEASRVLLDMLLLHPAPKSTSASQRTDSDLAPVYLPHGAAKAPKAITRYTVLRSPHVDKKAREQFEKKVYKRRVASPKLSLSELRWLMEGLRTYTFPGVQLQVAVRSSLPLPQESPTTQPGPGQLDTDPASGRPQGLYKRISQLSLTCQQPATVALALVRNALKSRLKADREALAKRGGIYAQWFRRHQKEAHKLCPSLSHLLEDDGAGEPGVGFPVGGSASGGPLAPAQALATAVEMLLGGLDVSGAGQRAHPLVSIAKYRVTPGPIQYEAKVVVEKQGEKGASQGSVGEGAPFVQEGQGPPFPTAAEWVYWCFKMHQLVNSRVDRQQQDVDREWYQFVQSVQYLLLREWFAQTAGAMKGHYAVPEPGVVKEALATAGGPAGGVR